MEIAEILGTICGIGFIAVTGFFMVRFWIRADRREQEKHAITYGVLSELRTYLKKKNQI